MYLGREAPTQAKAHLAMLMPAQSLQSTITRGLYADLAREPWCLL